MSGKPIIKLNDVVKVYMAKTGGVTALRGVSMEIFPNEIVAIMGPSGSGKTTLLSIIGGLDIPNAGEVVVNGHEIHKSSPEVLDEFRLKNIGFVFQFLNLISKLTVEENIKLPMIAVNMPKDRVRERVLKLASLLGLEDKLNRMAEELSGGEQQRVAIAAAAAHDPPIIIADEPTAELDTETIEKVLKFFRVMRDEGKTIIIATHDPRVAKRMDRIFVIEDGSIKDVYTSGEISSGSMLLSPTYRDFIKGRLEEIDREIMYLESRFRKGELDADSFVEKYRKLKEIKSFLESEVKF